MPYMTNNTPERKTSTTAGFISFLFVTTFFFGWPILIAVNILLWRAVFG